MKGPTRSVCDSAAETPTPREPDSRNRKITTITQTSGETRKIFLRVWLREARAEAGGHSGQHSPDPAVHATSQTQTLPGSCSQPLCSAEGTGPVAGELQHGSAGALAAEEGGHALDPTALRAEALLGGRGAEGACSENRLCIGWDDREFSEFYTPKCFKLLFPLVP